jgi:hypothetical protein
MFKYTVIDEVLTAMSMKMAVFWVVAKWYESTDVSEVCTACIIRKMRTHRPDDGGSTDL